ncbi:hypothetical protein [Helicobacter bizzozeronii]|uniref:hypothetical protein n=1 Tax=Helicobacter bizzozeronii TaxID=56877 RepID=UPI000CEF25C9|nr:hypothetical protein [Helicobacter bizzozeronii]
MQEPKKPMWCYELEKYLIENGVGEVATLLMKKAYKNYGWIDHPFISSQTNIQIAWQDIADNCKIRYGDKAYYFFAKICQERQEMQHVPVWDSEILAEFLHHLAEPYASYDPSFKEYEDNAQEDIKDCSFYFGDEDQIDEETLGQRIQDTIDDIVSTKAREQWSTYFYENLGAIKTKTHIEVATEKLAFLPQEASVALETYRQDHAYVFSLKRHLVPKTLPEYNPHHVFAFLYKQKRMHQKKLEKAIRHLAHPKRKTSIRYQRTKFCLKRHCGLITPAYVAEFQLNDPAQDKFFEPYNFTHTNQEKHYYIADALWVWF